MLPTMMLRSKSVFPASARLLRRRLLSSSNSNVPVVTTASDSNNALQVDLATAADIQGEESQVAIVQLRPGETLRAEAGAMLYMTHGVDMETSSDVSSGMKRFFTGQNVFVTDFRYQGDKEHGEVALGTDFPSKILRLHLPDFPDETLICQKGAYLASDSSIGMEMAFTKSFTSGWFGGEGFVLQKLQGAGDVLVKAGGTVVRKELEEGQTLRVSSGSLVAMTCTVDYDVQLMPGFKNVVFGGEGLFVTTLRGPGTVWLQGMPPDRMISEIARRVPQGMGLGIPIGLGGSSGGTEGEGAEAAGDGSEEMVAASDAAVDADRQATVASSGVGANEPVDGDSPSALFGDAAGESDAVPPLQQQDAIPSDPWQQEEPTFSDDTTIASDDSFEEESFSTEDTFSDDLFQDDSTFSDFDDNSLGDAAESAQDTASSIFSTLWDLFSGDD